MSYSRTDTHRLTTALTAIIAFAGLTVAGPALAETPQEKGLRIAQEADAADQGWGDSSADLVMILRNRHGEESVRQLRNRALEVEGDGDKSMIIFDEPRDVAGTAMLTFSHALEPDEQWLFLPALKRVKRIASNNKSGPFMGSEFAYEDLSSQEVEKYTYRFLREDTYEGTPVYVIERYPEDPKSGYTKQIAWIDQVEYRVLKVEFYDRKESHLKTLVARDWQEYLGEYWRPGEMEMTNHQTGKSTVLRFEGYEFGTGLSEDDFSQNALRKAR